MDIIRSTLATVFIIILMSFLTLYIHKQIDERATYLSNKNIKYIYVNEDTRHIPGSSRLVVESVIDFPISYGGEFKSGYIIKDEATDVKYIFINYGKNGNSIMTRYWEK